MEPRISLVTLGVADLDRSRRFYAEALGFPTSGDPTAGIVVLKMSTGSALALFPYGDLAHDVGPGYDHPRSTFPGITLGHNVRSRHEVHRRLAEAEAAGATIVKPAADTDWGGYSGYFADPDGYLWEVVHAPGFELDESGALILP